MLSVSMLYDNNIEQLSWDRLRKQKQDFLNFSERPLFIDKLLYINICS